MEVLLLRKNRHLEHQLTMARLQVAEAGGELSCMLGVLSPGGDATAGWSSDLSECWPLQCRSDDCLKCCVSNTPLPAVGLSAEASWPGTGTHNCTLHPSQYHQYLPPADSVEAAEAQVGKLQAELQMLKALNGRLEEDLLAAERSVGRQLHR